MLRISRLTLRGRARTARSNVFGRLDWTGGDSDEQEAVAQFREADNQENLIAALENILPKAYIPTPPTKAGATWAPANAEMTKSYRLFEKKKKVKTGFFEN